MTDTNSDRVLVWPRVAATTGLLHLALAASLAAQDRIDYDSYRLDNGLRVILVEDHSTPIVTVDVWYDVGAANERPGRSGFAHLFEHMMFQGSANVGKTEHMQLIERAGGTLNGSTTSDHTNYFQTVPANRLNLALWLEADRMRSLEISEENLDNQRNAVQEERRLRIDNQPYAGALVEGFTMLYDSTTCFAYAHSTIGSMADLNAANVADVQAFFDRYYIPNNATLTVVGDFDPEHAKTLIEEYFGDIAAGADPPPVRCEWQIGTEARTEVWPDPKANLPAVFSVYRIPAHDHPDTPALSLLSTILGGGESSRLNVSLVRERQSSLQAQVQILSQQWASPFIVLAIANQGVSADSLAAQIREQVALIGRHGVTEDELTKAKNTFRSTNIFGRQTTLSVAERFQHYVHFHERLEDMTADVERFMAVTAQDITRVANTYLTPENSLTLLVVPPPAADTPVP